MSRTRRPLDPTQFPPVSYASQLEGFRSPTFIPGNPNNLPPNGSRAAVRNLSLIAPSAAGDTLPDLNAPPAQNINDRWHRAEIIEGFILAVSVVADPAAQLFLNRPPGGRNLLILRNVTATGNILIGNGNLASLNSPIILVPGQMILFDSVVPQQDLYAFASAVATSLAFGFSNIA